MSPYISAVLKPSPKSCDSSPCSNNGICLDRKPGYDCLCNDGFAGKNCDQGTCQPGSYSCHCNFSFHLPNDNSYTVFQLCYHRSTFAVLRPVRTVGNVLKQTPDTRANATRDISAGFANTVKSTSWRYSSGWVSYRPIFILCNTIRVNSSKEQYARGEIIRSNAVALSLSRWCSVPVLNG